MLDCDTETVPTVAELERLPCSVILPAAWESDFELRGMSPSLPGCKRRFPRLRCRGKRNLVALEHRQTLPGLPRARAWYSVYPTDIGRGGVAFLHGEPLYPQERLRVMIFDGRLMHIEIVRCQRVDIRCFSIGSQFVDEQ
jgi:hypothetical protein